MECTESPPYALLQLACGKKVTYFYMSSIDTSLNVHFIFLRIHYTKYNDVTVLLR